MRYVLLAGTAAVALVVGANAASAQMTLTLSGDNYFEAGWINEKGENGTRKTEVRNRTRLVVDASGKADNGLQYGAKARIRLRQQGNLDFDQSYAFVATPEIGQLQLGTNTGVNDAMRIFAPNNFGTGGIDGSYTDWISGLPNSTGNEYFVTGDTETRIQFYSSRFAGFQVGLGYLPTSGSAGTDINRSRFFSTATNANVAPSRFQDIYEANLQYSADFGPATVKASLGYEGGAAKDARAGALGTGFGAVNLRDLSAYQAGVQVGFGGLLIGAGYTDNSLSGLPQGGGKWVDQWEWNAGVAYTAGPVTVGYNFERSVGPFSPSAGTFSTAATPYNSFGAVTANIHVVGTTYVIAKGLSAGIEYTYADIYNPPGASSVSKPTANLVLLRTDVAF